MKKIIAIFVIMLAFGVNANAQQKATTTAKAPVAQTQEDVKAAATKDVEALNKVVAFEGSQKRDFQELFETKHKHLKENLSDERKDVLANTIEAKLKATLTPAQFEKVAAAPGLIKQLTR